MPATWYDCLHLCRRPHWDVDKGNWYVKQGALPTVPVDRISDVPPTPMYRHKPEVSRVCGPLVNARYLSVDQRLRIYREGIELVIVFGEYDDLITLATYRRQVTHRGGVPLDTLFFNLACDAGFTKAQWQELADRMPDRAPIKEACLRRATLPRAIAAE